MEKNERRRRVIVIRLILKLKYRKYIELLLVINNFETDYLSKYNLIIKIVFLLALFSLELLYINMFILKLFSI